MNSKIIAVDFDGTLCENKWPEIGRPNEELIHYLLDQKKKSAKLILWTCRVGKLLEAAVQWSSEQGLFFDAVNENLPETLKWQGGDSRKIFAHEYIDDRAKRIIDCREKSGMEFWAEREVVIACKQENPDRKEGEFDYGCACYESALKAFRSLCEDGHSGMSIGFTKQILNRLIDGKPLTPIEDTEDIWNSISDISGLEGEAVNYQCQRMSSLFKYVYSDGSIEYKDVDRFIGINIDNPNAAYHSGLIDRVMSKRYPITMPYCPENEPFKVYCEEFLTDRANGDFDTVGILYAIKPGTEHKRVVIQKYFKEGSKDFVEIDKNEFEERRIMAQKLREEEAGNHV